MAKAAAQLALIDPPKQEAPKLTPLALVEIFGHQRLVGWMTVDPVEFPGMVRVDVPDLVKDGKTARHGFTRYFGRAALYSVTPIDEETLKKLLPSIDGSPGAARPYSMREDWQ